MEIEREVVKRLAERLKHMGALMLTQSPRGTQSPIYVVYQKREVVGRDDYSDGDNDGAHAQFIEQITGDNGAFDSIEDGIKDLKAEGYQDVTESDFEELWVIKVRDFVSVFFTEKAAQDFIDRNGHNLREPYIYVESAWNNPELQDLMSDILLLAIAQAPMLMEIPSHYKNNLLK